MAIAYRHLVLGSPKQVMHFIKQRLPELDKEIEVLEAENEMWTKVDDRKGNDTPSEARGHLRARQYELSAKIGLAKWEVIVLGKLHDSYHPCPECKGFGETFYQEQGDTIAPRTCAGCKGTGTRP